MAGKLSVYRAKRDFNKTAEPSGKLPVKDAARSRFVIQKHAARRLHFDLRLELDGVFKSWAVTRGPSLSTKDKRLAVEVEDHPLDYGDFEGTIPQGQYGGGTVQLWDRGYWQPDGTKSAAEQLKKGELKFELDGARLHGGWVLVRLKRREGEKRNNWLLIKHRDEHASDTATERLMAEDRSVASGRPMAQIAGGKGKGPKPFMLDTKRSAKPDDVWQSNRAHTSEYKLRPAARPARAAMARRKRSSGDNAPKQHGDVRWLRPELVAEIEFAGWTGAGNIRQAAFKGLREDKPAREVAADAPAPAEEVEVKQPVGKASRSRAATPSGSRERARARSTGRASVNAAAKAAGNVVLGVPISSADKPLWPGGQNDAKPITKLDLARYYEAVGEWMLEHVKGRPCSVIRAPDGIQGERFFQRHAMPGTSNLITLTRFSGDRKPYLQLDRVEALIAVAQTAGVELHPWNNEPGRPQVPGRLVFDLDPAPDVAFDTVIEAAKEMRERLEALGLVTFCKTTGGKGLHVVTPLKQQRNVIEWPAAKAFAQAVCARVAEDTPSKYLVNMSKKLRGGKIFLDYLRNDRMATAVAPLSPRAREGAPVSMPIQWSQVRAGLDPLRFDLRTVPALLVKSTAWEDYCASLRPLAAAIKRLAGTKTVSVPAIRSDATHRTAVTHARP